MRTNYSKRKKRFSIRKFIIIIYIIIFFCLLAGIGYFLIWSPYLWINNIKVEGYNDLEIKNIVEGKLSNSFWKGIPQKSIVLIPVDQIKKDILEKYPKIKDVHITRKLPNILNIQINQRENIGVWCQIEKEEEKKINQCFYFDSEGIIFQDAPLIKGSLILNVYGTKSPIKIRDKVMSEEIVKFILDVKNGLSKISLPEAVDFEVVSFEDLIVTTVQGWQIYFNPTYSVGLQLEALKLVIEKEVQDTLNSIKYFDLKIQGRVYYQ